MSRSSITIIDVSLFAHATEDEDKVLRAVQNLFPSECWDSVTFTRKNLWGHHKNPIILFETKIKDKEVIQAFIKSLSSNLSVMDKQELLEEIGRYVERGSLFLRLDKQVAFRGSRKLCTADPIRVRIRLRKNKLVDVVQICQELGILP